MKDISVIVEALKENESFLITAHVHPDGDSIGSQLALAHCLTQMGKDVIIINSDPVPPAYAFLPGSRAIISPPSNISQFFDAALILDCQGGKRLGKVESLLNRAKTTIVIDHHPTYDPSKSGLGDINFIDPSYSAVGEVIYDLIQELGIELDYVLALNLYVSILTDTGGFRHSNTTPRLHRIIAGLIEKGLNVSEIATLIYETNPLPLVQLIGDCISILKIEQEGKIAWISITSQMLKNRGIPPEEIEGEKIIDIIRSIKSVMVSVLFRETDDKLIRVNLRSKNGIKVNQTAVLFGGGGHPYAAGCTLNASLFEAEKKVIGELKSLLSMQNAECGFLTSAF
ncbi:MAG: bifunctional oligoribonuclease/PAP phosphatase NrnA [bacterium]